MDDFKDKVAVITGAGSGFGLEFARLGARLGMKLVLADIQRDALDAALVEVRVAGADATGVLCDVAHAGDVESLAGVTRERFGAAHLLFNNAGVGGTGGFLWEHSEKDWQWVLGVNLWGVIHGIRSFVPMMMAQGERCHVVNTASVAGLLSVPMAGAYNASKHAVVTISETLHHDLRLAGANIGVSVLCPAFVRTGIAESHRNRPAHLADERPLTPSQEAARAAMQAAVGAGRLTAAEVAEMTFEAIRQNRFYVITHPKILASVQLRHRDIEEGRSPSDPFSFKPELAARVA